MKAYICDVCNLIIENPFSVRMVEFTQSCEFTDHGVLPKPWKKRRKIHMCKKCYERLNELFNDMEGKVNEKDSNVI